MTKILNVVLIAILSLFTVFHFSMLFLHAGPLNPVKIKSKSIVEAYTYPIFNQNWQLFAPNPINITSHILVQYQTKDDEISDWHNISKPLTSANQKNLISAYNKAARIPVSLYHGIFSEGEIIDEYRSTVTEEEFNENIDVEKLSEEKESQVEMLYRFAFSSIPLITSEEIKKINTRIVNQHPIPFSERFNDSYKVENEYIELGWKDYESVMPY